MEIAKKLADYDNMKAQMDNVKDLYEEKENYRQLCDSLYNDGVIKQDANGGIVPVEDMSEREQIRSKTKQKILQEQSQHEQSVNNMPEFDQTILNQEEDQMEQIKWYNKLNRQRAKADPADGTRQWCRWPRRSWPCTFIL